MCSLVQQWIHAHASVYILSGSQLFGVCTQEFRYIWLSLVVWRDEMHMFGPSMETRSCVSPWVWSFHRFLVSDSHLFSAVSPEKYRNLNTRGDDFWSCFRILGSTADQELMRLFTDFGEHCTYKPKVIIRHLGLSYASLLVPVGRRSPRLRPPSQAREPPGPSPLGNGRK